MIFLSYAISPPGRKSGRWISPGQPGKIDGSGRTRKGGKIRGAMRADFRLRRGPGAGERVHRRGKPGKGGGNNAISELGRDQGRARYAVRSGGAARPGREAPQPGPEPVQPPPAPETRP